MVALEKEKANEKVKQLYALNANLDEPSVKRERKKIYKEVINSYGNWDKALRANGLTKRKIREREKFVLYFILKRRYEKYGSESMRPKNVKPEEIKERIVNSFKTLKGLKDIVKNWNEDKVLYELHARFLTGCTIENVEKDEPELYEEMLDHFKDLNHAIEAYDKRFGVPSIKPYVAEEIEEYKKEEKETVNVTSNDDLINMMIKLNYIEKQEDAEALAKASNITNEEMISYLFSVLADAQIKGEKVSEKSLKEKDASMYFAIKAKYQSLENALHDITKSIVGTG